MTWRPCRLAGAAHVVPPCAEVISSPVTVSCGSAGSCSAGGSYSRIGSTRVEAFVVDEVHGRWGHAQEVPGTAALNRGGNAVVASLSCASASHCSAGGYYRGRSGQQAFVVDKS